MSAARSESVLWSGAFTEFCISLLEEVVGVGLELDLVVELGWSLSLSRNPKEDVVEAEVGELMKEEMKEVKELEQVAASSVSQ